MDACRTVYSCLFAAIARFVICLLDMALSIEAGNRATFGTLNWFADSIESGHCVVVVGALVGCRENDNIATSHCD